MQEQLQFLIGEIQSALRFRWFGFFLAAVICLAGWAYVATLPDVYEAQARFILNTSSMLERALEDQIVATDPEARLAAVRESLFGREELADVARAVGLDADADSPIAFELMLTALQRDIIFESMTPDTGSRTADRIYQLSYRHQDRAIALAVIETLLNTFVEGALDDSRRDEEEAIRSLDEQIRMADMLVVAVETEEANFKRENADRLPGAQGDYQRRLDAAEQALAEARRSRNSLRSRLEQHDRQLERLSQFVLNSGAELDPDSLPAQIRRLELEIDRESRRLQPSHPDFEDLVSALETLEQQYAEELEAAGVEDTGTGLLNVEANRVYQEAEIARSETELDIAEREAEISDLQQEIADLLSRRDESLTNEAELSRLEGNSEDAREELATLRAARTELQRTVAVQSDSPVQYRPVDEPFASQIPVGPARLKMFLMVFVGAVGVGGAFCYLFAQIRPVFSGARSLQQFAELPVLGTVTNAWPAGEASQLRRAVLAYGLALTILLSLLIVLVGIERFGPGMHALLPGG